MTQFPILFDSNAEDFSTNGIGVLSDTIDCTVHVSLNGYSTFEMRYPVTGIHFADFAYRKIIAAPSEVDGSRQGFRVYKISKPINGICTIYAYALAYDLSGYAVVPYSASSCAEALRGIAENATDDCPFTFWTDKSTTGNFSVDVPTQANQIIGGHSGSILDVYGGEYEFDNYTIKLHNHRGQDRGVTLRYGKNITDYKQDENCENVYTALLPYWADADGNITMLSEKTIKCEGTYNFSRVLVVDASHEFEEQPTEDDLRSWGQSYIERNEINIPIVSWTINFIPLDQTEEYKDVVALRERIWLGDTVHVYFEMYDVEASARCVGYTYNVITNKYDSISLGSVSATLASQTVASEQQAQDANKQQTSFLQNAITNATQQITGNVGGYVVLHSSTGGKQPDEILIMDTPDINTATKVWRWNKSGLGYSSTGYNGEYALAMTQDGAIVADFVTTGTLRAIQIIGVVIEGSTIKGSEFYSLGTQNEWLRLRNGIITGGMVENGSEKEWGRIDYDATYGPDRCMTFNSHHTAILTDDLLTEAYSQDVAQVVAYKGQNTTLNAVQSANYKEFEFDCIQSISATPDGGISWESVQVKVPYISGLNTKSYRFVNGILVTK